MNLNKKKKEPQLPDRQRLLDDMNRIISGETILISEDDYLDSELAQTLNRLTVSLKRLCNEPTMRINESLATSTSDSIISDMLESVSSQTSSIENMRGSSDHLIESNKEISNVIGDIKQFVDKAVDSSEKSVNYLSRSIDEVTRSASEINTINVMIQDFKGKTEQISSIVSLVKSIAQKSNLLALNAAIEAARAGEAGRGFAVVAGEVKTLAENTTSSTEDISRYVSELQKGIDELALTMEHTADELLHETTVVGESMNDIHSINEQMGIINDKINNIYSNVQEQHATTTVFMEAIDTIADSYASLKKSCDDVGQFLFRTIRSIDKSRGALARDVAYLSTPEWLQIFEVDHIIFTWRLHNAVGKYEELVLTNLQNFKGCKLGKWMDSITDSRILQLASFKNMNRYHQELHKKAVECYNAIQEDHTEEALRFSDEAEQILAKMMDSLHALQKDPLMQ